MPRINVSGPIGKGLQLQTLQLERRINDIDDRGGSRCGPQSALDQSLQMLICTKPRFQTELNPSSQLKLPPSHHIYIITQAVKKGKGKFKRQVGGQRRHRFRLHPPPLSTLAAVKTSPSYPHTATGLTLTSFHPFNALVSSARSSLAPQHHRNFVRFHSFQRDSAPQCHNTRFLSFHLSCFFPFHQLTLLLSKLVPSVFRSSTNLSVSKEL